MNSVLTNKRRIFIRMIDMKRLSLITCNLFTLLSGKDFEISILELKIKSSVSDTSKVKKVSFIQHVELISAVQMVSLRYLFN